MNEEKKEFTSESDELQLISRDELNKIVQQEVSSFKKFAFRGNMIQMSVAFMLGAVFNKFITSLSENVIMPFINFIIGQTGVPWRKLNITPIEGLTIELGKFLSSSIDFMVISLILYIVYIKIMKGQDLHDKKCQLQKKK